MRERYLQLAYHMTTFTEVAGVPLYIGGGFAFRYDSYIILGY